MTSDPAKSPVSQPEARGSSNPIPAEVSPAGLTRSKIFLFFFGVIVFLLVVCEAGARLYLRLTNGYDGEHLYQYVFDPYKNILPAPNFVDTRGIRHNAQGFRRDSFVRR